MACSCGDSKCICCESCSCSELLCLCIACMRVRSKLRVPPVNEVPSSAHSREKKLSPDSKRFDETVKLSDSTEVTGKLDNLTVPPTTQYSKAETPEKLRLQSATRSQGENLDEGVPYWKFFRKTLIKIWKEGLQSSSSLSKKPQLADYPYVFGHDKYIFHKRPDEQLSISSRRGTSKIRKRQQSGSKLKCPGERDSSSKRNKLQSPHSAVEYKDLQRGSIEDSTQQEKPIKVSPPPLAALFHQFPPSPPALNCPGSPSTYEDIFKQNASQTSQKRDISPPDANFASNEQYSSLPQDDVGDIDLGDINFYDSDKKKPARVQQTDFSNVSQLHDPLNSNKVENPLEFLSATLLELQSSSTFGQIENFRKTNTPDQMTVSSPEDGSENSGPATPDKPISGDLYKFVQACNSFLEKKVRGYAPVTLTSLETPKEISDFDKPSCSKEPQIYICPPDKYICPPDSSGLSSSTSTSE